MKDKTIHTPKGPLKTMTFMQGCKDFFGTKEGQTPIQFLHEVQKLTEQDREEIKAGLKKHGYNIVAAGVQG